MASDDDLDAAREILAPWIADLIGQYRADLVVGPHPQDPHPAHHAVARAVGDAIPRTSRPPVWWAWSIWGDLPRPTLLVPIGPDVIHRVETALRCYHGEIERNDYVAMMRADGIRAAIKGTERVVGFGARALPGVRHAELLTELGWLDGLWRVGHRRIDARPELPTGWAEVTDELEPLRHTERLG